MNNRLSKNKLIAIMSVIVALVSVFGALLLPDYFLRGEVKSRLGIADDVPADYYMAHGGAAAKASSMKMSDVDRIKMISGVWGSTMTKVDTADAYISETEALKLSRKATEYYHGLGIYPVSIDSSFDNWYSWKAECYRYLDNIFNTYTCFLWVVEFFRYDSNEHHIIYLLEDGTAICMLNNMSETEKTYDPAIAFRPANIQNTLSSVNRDKTELKSTSVTEISDFLPDLSFSGMEIKGASELTINKTGDDPDKLLMLDINNVTFKEKNGYHGFFIKAVE
ncbi:MAG: hypothetical protein IKQ71_09840 [Lachnospiraceae bacterium]|nr:hypothetical protein [Lachnospiraceae bacterium]